MLFHEVWELGRFQSANTTFKVIQGHWQWCHSIGHIRFLISLPLQLCLYLAPFPRYYHLFPKILRGHVTLNTSVLRVIYHACSSTPVYQSISTRNFKCLVSLIVQIRLGQNLKKWVMWPWPWPWSVIPRLALDIFYQHTKFGDSRFSCSGDMIAGIQIENGSCDLVHAPCMCVQNVTILALAVLETSLWHQNLKWVRVICPRYAGTWYSQPVYKIWWVSFSHYRDMIGAHQNLNGSLDLTNAPFRHGLPSVG